MNVSIAFRPKLADALKNYTKQDFLHDLTGHRGKQPIVASSQN